MTESFDPLIKLEELIAHLTSFPSQRRFNSVGYQPYGPEISPLEKLKYFSQALLSGALPNAETLFFIALSLDNYINRPEQYKTLDAAFGLPEPLQKAGSISKQEAKTQEYNNLLFEMGVLRGRSKIEYSKKLSQYKAAKQVLHAKSIHSDPDCRLKFRKDKGEDPAAALAREYRDRKNKSLTQFAENLGAEWAANDLKNAENKVHFLS